MARIAERNQVLRFIRPTKALVYDVRRLQQWLVLAFAAIAPRPTTPEPVALLALGLVRIKMRFGLNFS